LWKGRSQIRVRGDKHGSRGPAERKTYEENPKFDVGRVIIRMKSVSAWRIYSEGRWKARSNLLLKKKLQGEGKARKKESVGRGRSHISH